MLENKTSFRLAGAVILYNPEEVVSENVLSYIDSVDKLYIVDNSLGASVASKISKLAPNKVQVITNKQNEGIAKPLNLVLHLAEKEGFDFLLTMDQDSRFFDGHMALYRSALSSIDWKHCFGLGPTSVVYERLGEGKEDKEELSNKGIHWNSVMRMMTSGNIISVKKAVECGGFDETLFIDEVDHDICYKALLHGYLLFTSPDILLWHRCGNPIKKRFFWRDIHAMNHPPVRKYYIARNRSIVYKRYHHINEAFFFKHYIRSDLLDFLKIFYMEPDKLRKAQFFLRGLWDAGRGCTGKIKFS